MNNISESFSMPESKFLRRICLLRTKFANIKYVARHLCLTGMMLKCLYLKILTVISFLETLFRLYEQIDTVTSSQFRK